MSVPGTVPGICVAALPNVAPIQQIVDVRFGYRANITSSDVLLAEREADIVVLTMNRPPANVLNVDLVSVLLDRSARRTLKLCFTPR